MPYNQTISIDSAGNNVLAILAASTQDKLYVDNTAQIQSTIFNQKQKSRQK